MMMQSNRLILGIDGGGTKTVAWLAVCDDAAELNVVGRAVAGGSNPQAVGWEAALESLDNVLPAVFDAAGVNRGPAAAAVLGMAGSDRDENRKALERWAIAHSVTDKFRVVHDALPVLAAGSAEGWGIALISGTGSLAFGQDRDGHATRSGGWGYLFGDEGSGYAIAQAALRAAAQAADGRGPETQLLDALLKRLELKTPADLIPAVYEVAHDRAAIAALAEVVTKVSAMGDPVAQQVIDRAAEDLATMVAAVAEQLGFIGTRFPLALAGGALLGNQQVNDSLRTRLSDRGLQPEPITDVHDPVVGALRLARQLTHPCSSVFICGPKSKPQINTDEHG